MFDKFAPRQRRPFGRWLSRQFWRLYNQPADRFAGSANLATVPILIVGCGNSGTSLLASLMSRHEDVFTVGFESGFCVPPSDLRHTKLTAQYWDKLARQRGFSAFLEKTPKHIVCLPRIQRVLGSARIIAMVRDGRETVCSFRRRGFDTIRAIERWHTDNDSLARHRNAANVLVCHYERLTEAPAAELERICAFAQLPYSGAMLTPRASPYSWIERGTMAQRADETTATIAPPSPRWPGDLSASAQDAFWRKNGKLMAQFGYC